MQRNISFSYKEFVDCALAGGTIVAATLEQARRTVNEVNRPCVIKLLAEFDGEYREAFLQFTVEAGARGIWVICCEAPFLEPKKADEDILDSIARPFILH